VRGGRAWVGSLSADAEGHTEGDDVHVVVRSYDLKFWRDDAGPATVQRVLPLGDRVRVEVELDAGGPLFAQFPRRSSLLAGVEPGARIAVQITHARTFPATP
ncbi:MAG: TOBE-like domain-containing protein, partial [Myxococcota bacterium]